jgi:iron complex outermembrane receptor protein
MLLVRPGWIGRPCATGCCANECGADGLVSRAAPGPEPKLSEAQHASGQRSASRALGISSLTQIQNGPDANIKGFETAAAFRATDQLTLSSDLTVQDPRVTANLCASDPSTGLPEATCTGGNIVISKGEQLPFTSKIKGSFTARDTVPLSGDWIGHAQGTLSFQNSSSPGLRVIDKGVLKTSPGYATLDLSTGVDYHDISLELFAKNVTNERGQENRYITCSICTNIYVLPITPTTVGIRLSQKF